MLDFDVIIEGNRAFLPLCVQVRFGGQWLERGSLDFVKQRAPARPQVPRDAIVELGQQFADGSVISASEKNCRLRNLAAIQRVATCTATSTLALSRGFPGRAGTMAVP